MVRNIMVVDENPLIRLDTIMKFVGGSSFILIRDGIIGRQHCAKHKFFEKNCLPCQRISSHRLDIKEEKQCITKFKQAIAQSNKAYMIYKRCQDVDQLDSIIRKSFGIKLDAHTRTVEKLRNIIRIKKSGVQRTALSKEENECLDHMWTTPHAFIILGDLASINTLMNNMEIVDLVNSVDNPFIHVFYELEHESQIPEMLIEYEINGVMSVIRE